MSQSVEDIYNEMIKRATEQTLAGNHYDTTTCFLSSDNKTVVHIDLRSGGRFSYRKTTAENPKGKKTFVFDKMFNIETELKNKVNKLVEEGYKMDKGCLKDWKGFNFVNDGNSTYHYYKRDEKLEPEDARYEEWDKKFKESKSKPFNYNKYNNDKILSKFDPNAYAENELKLREDSGYKMYYERDSYKPKEKFNSNLS